MKLLVLALALQQPSQQFNLLCTGTMQAVSATPPAPVPFTRRYRIDLDRRLFCEEDCSIQWEISAVHPTILTLTDRHWHSNSGGTDLATINRQNGAYHMERTIGSGSERAGVVRDGSCRVEPFSGISSVRTAF